MPTTDERIAALETLAEDQAKEIKRLRAQQNLWRQNGLDALDSGNQFEFGGGIARLDDNGLKILRNVADYHTRGIFWVSDMNNPVPAAFAKTSRIVGYNTAGNNFIDINAYRSANELARAYVFAQPTSVEALIQTNYFGSGAGVSVNSSDGSFNPRGWVGISGLIIIESADTVTVSGNTNNWVPGNLDRSDIIRVSSSAGNVNITGITNPAPQGSPTFFLRNVDTTDTITLTDEDAASTAANRFALPGGNMAIPPDGCVILQYDATSTRWRCVGASPGIRGTDDIGRDRLLYYQHYPQDSL